MSTLWGISIWHTLQNLAIGCLVFSLENLLFTLISLGGGTDTTSMSELGFCVAGYLNSITSNDDECLFYLAG